MCGIAGLYLPRNAPPVEANLEAMIRIMAHRGPDGQGRHITPDRRYQSSFARLAIIDLETGDQPILAEDGARVLTGNGEIYNYRELRQSPMAKTYPYRTNGDMEVVLPLARALGKEFVHQLNGMYALALYDSNDDRLLLVRDRLGIKPLYWAKLPSGAIVYASEIKALFASGLINPEINEWAVSAYLAHGYVPAPATLFKGVNKLPPGHILEASGDGSLKIECYWQARPAENLPEGQDAIENHLVDLLRDSVRLQLRSDVPIGALLSGGLDSGLIVALAAEQSAQALNTFTVRFEGAPVDETPLAASVAKRYGTRHEELFLSTSSVTRLLPKLAWFSDDLLSDPALLPNYLISEQLSARTTVALNGTGGDELFAGYGRYFQLPIERRYLKIPGPMRRRIIEPAIGVVSEMNAWRLSRAAKFFDDRGTYLHEHSTLFPPPILKLIGHRAAAVEAAQRKSFAAFDGPAQTGALIADLETYLPEDLLTLLDRSTMAVGVEGRVPFLDHRLVEAALAVPPAIRTAGNQQKFLERQIAQRFLPDAVVDAPKQGFASPVPAWMNETLTALCRSMLTRRETLERGWWTAAGIDRLLADSPRHSFRLHALLMLELSVRIHIEQSPSATPPEGDLAAFALAG
jgi:asparagine synthase (glutamine-hydrolysing)